MPFVGGRFINPAYWEGLSVVPVVLLAYAVHGISVVLMVSVYKSGRTGILPMVTGSAAVVNVLANMVLLPVFGIVGGAWATLVAYAVSSGIMVYRTRALWPVPWEWARVAIALGLAGAFVSVPWLLPLEGALRVVVCVVLLAAYPVLLIFLRVVPFSALADLVTSFIQRLRR
jgi:O-antigen/teichoic acid export membrane protein